MVSLKLKPLAGWLAARPRPNKAPMAPQQWLFQLGEGGKFDIDYCAGKARAGEKSFPFSSFNNSITHVWLLRNNRRKLRKKSCWLIILAFRFQFREKIERGIKVSCWLGSKQNNNSLSSLALELNWTALNWTELNRAGRVIQIKTHLNSRFSILNSQF